MDYGSEWHPTSWRSHSACNPETCTSPTDLVVPPRNKLWHGSYFKAPQIKTYRNTTLEPDLENTNSFLDTYFFLCPTSIPPLIWMVAIWIKMREETNAKKAVTKYFIYRKELSFLSVFFSPIRTMCCFIWWFQDSERCGPPYWDLWRSHCRHPGRASGGRTLTSDTWLWWILLY